MFGFLGFKETGTSGRGSKPSAQDMQGLLTGHEGVLLGSVVIRHTKCLYT